MKLDYIDDGREATRDEQDEDRGNRVPKFELNPEFDDEDGRNILQIAKDKCLAEEAERVRAEEEQFREAEERARRLQELRRLPRQSANFLSLFNPPFR